MHEPVHDERVEPVDQIPLLWRRPWWTQPGVLALAWACVIAYGSMVPFDLDVAAFAASHDSLAQTMWQWIQSPRWVGYRDARSTVGLSFAASDLLANIALYAPLGLLLRLAMAKRLRSGWMQIAAASSLLSLMSWSIECTQALSPSRYASLNDFVANAGAGAVCAILAPTVRDATWAAMFQLHRWTAWLTLPLLDGVCTLRRGVARRVPRAAVGVIIGPAVLIVAGAVLASDQVTLPFTADFLLPYDAAAIEVSRRLGPYILLAALLSPWLVWRSALGGGWVRLAAVMMLPAAGASIMQRGGSFDLTEPALAIAAASGLLIAGFVAVHGVRRRCRRRGAAPVAHDRRRRPHDYRFALR